MAYEADHINNENKSVPWVIYNQNKGITMIVSNASLKHSSRCRLSFLSIVLVLFCLSFANKSVADIVATSVAENQMQHLQELDYALMRYIRLHAIVMENNGSDLSIKEVIPSDFDPIDQEIDVVRNHLEQYVATLGSEEEILPLIQKWDSVEEAHALNMKTARSLLFVDAQVFLDFIEQAFEFHEELRTRLNVLITADDELATSMSRELRDQAVRIMFMSFLYTVFNPGISPENETYGVDLNVSFPTMVKTFEDNLTEMVQLDKDNKRLKDAYRQWRMIRKTMWERTDNWMGVGDYVLLVSRYSQKIADTMIELSKEESTKAFKVSKRVPKSVAELSPQN